MNGSMSTSSGSDFVCLYLDDFGEKVEVEEHEEGDQSSCSQVAQSGIPCRKRGRNTATRDGAKEAKRK